jgi:hypothetical protein
MSILIRPTTTVLWDGVDISNAAYNIKIEWGNTENFPSISFSVDQFQVDEKLRRSVRKEIDIAIEYPTRSAKLTGKFLHTEVSESFGSESSLSLRGISKAATLNLSPRRQRNFVGDEVLAKIIGKRALEYGYSIVPEFIDEDLSLREYLQLYETDGEHLVHLAHTGGYKLYWTIDSDRIGILRPMTSNSVALENRIDPKKFGFFLLGPTLLERADRTITLETQGKNPSLSGKTQKGDKEKDKDLNPKKKDSVTTTIAQKPTRLKKKQHKSSNESPYSEAENKAGTEKVKERKDEAAREQEVKLSTSILMVPRLVGLKPGDGLFFVNDGLDYKIETVSYQQNGESYRLDISAERPISEKPLFPKSNDQMVELRKKLGDDEEKWAQYYWEPSNGPF